MKTERTSRSPANPAAQGSRWIVPAVLILLAVLMLILIVFAAGVLVGIVHF